MDRNEFEKYLKRMKDIDDGLRESCGRAIAQIKISEDVPTLKKIDMVQSAFLKHVALEAGKYGIDCGASTLEVAYRGPLGRGPKQKGSMRVIISDEYYGPPLNPLRSWLDGSLRPARDAVIKLCWEEAILAACLHPLAIATTGDRKMRRIIKTEGPSYLSFLNDVLKCDHLEWKEDPYLTIFPMTHPNRYNTRRLVERNFVGRYITTPRKGWVDAFYGSDPWATYGRDIR